MNYLYIIIVLLILTPITLEAQERPSQANFGEPGTNLWLGSYNKFRISKNLFWRAEFHYRRANYDNTPYIGRMAQIYNRHALNYIVTKNFNVSLGGVLRLDFTPEPGNPELDHVIPEPRIWHEYLFVMPWPRFQLYHRIRLEHRWSRTNEPASDWTFRNRFRYKFYMSIPLNKPQLVPGAIYFNPDVEIIMQSGKTIIDSPLEDLRLYPSIGYIFSPNVTYTAGMMYTLGQNTNLGSEFRQRWVLRINAYVSLDFRKKEKQVPSIRFSD